jgi:hypothetical protein
MIRPRARIRPRTAGAVRLTIGRWLLAAAGVALLLAGAGCAKTEKLEPAQAWRVEATLVGEEAASVQVRVYDLRPADRVEAIRLVGPQGQTGHPVDTVERKRITGGGSLARPSVGVGVVGGSSGHVSSGVGISVPIFSKRDSLRGVKEGREIIARIPIPDAPAYREAPEAWRIEIDLTDVTGQTRTRTLQAPEPK